MTPRQKACVIFEAYGSNDRTRWKWAYDELVSTIKERDDLLAEVAALKKDFEAMKRKHDYVIDRSKKLLTTPPQLEKVHP